MAEVSRERFLQAYGNLLAQSWGNPDLLKRFKAAPGSVLKEFGLDPEGASIEVITPGAGWASQGSPDAQVAMWNNGLKEGSIKLYFPEEAPSGELKTAELSEQELEAVAGGAVAACSCCPCSCC